MFLTLKDSNDMRSANNVSHRRRNPSRASTTPQSIRKDMFLYLSESSNDVEFPANEDDKYANKEDLKIHVENEKNVRIDFVDEIENEDSCSDQADDYYSKNEYHFSRSSDDDVKIKVIS